ncbi:MAG: hypothetical protein ACI4K7_11660 [Oscillospiraceae bacterium]
MDKLQMAEELIRRTNVTYSEATEALENTGWNMLDAIVYLEKQGKTTGSVKFGRVKKTVGGRLKKAWDFCCGHDFEIYYGNDRAVNIPLLAAIVITLCLFEIVLPAAVIALLCGCSFKISERSKACTEQGSCGFNITAASDRADLEK